MLAFKLARYFDPVKAYEIKPMKLSLAASDIDDLKLFSFIDSSTISGLKSELPQYLAASKDVSSASLLVLTSFSGGKDMQMSSPSDPMFAK